MSSPVDKLRLIANLHNVETLASVVLDDPKFSIWSGSGKEGQHHYGKGGLAQHVLEVTELSLNNFTYFEQDVFSDKKLHLEVQKLILACIFHDAGKMWDYEPVVETFHDTHYSESTFTDYSCWQKNKHARQVHHISRSAVVWTRAALNQVDDEFHDDVLHAILSHHGLREWGSPVAPATRVAWILHLSDGISARVSDVATFDRVK